MGSEMCIRDSFITGNAKAALATGTRAGIIPTDGSAVPTVRGTHGEIVSGPVSASALTAQRDVEVADGKD